MGCQHISIIIGPFEAYVLLAKYLEKSHHILLMSVGAFLDLKINNHFKNYLQE